YRVEGQRAHGLDGRAEQGGECPGRLAVVAVYPDPGDVRAARPPGGRGTDAVPRVDDVDRPQPGHVVRPLLTEHVDDAPPGSDELRRGRVPVSPAKPPAVHLMAETDDHRVAEGADGRRVGTQVGVVSARRDAGQRDSLRGHLDGRYLAD